VAAVLEEAGITTRWLSRRTDSRSCSRSPGRYTSGWSATRRRSASGAAGALGPGGAVPARADPDPAGRRLAIGAADWWLGPNVALPALVGVPLAELMVAWHQGHVRWGLSAYDTLAAWHRHLSAVAGPR